MEQRSLRLGDIVDDYCPRERRVTNHAIVALVGNVIKQTRCSTCESDHEYKEAKIPKKRGKAGGEGDLSGGVLVAPKAAPNGKSEPEVETAGEVAEPQVEETVEPAAAVAAAEIETDEDPNDPPQPGHDAWTGHRPLIRASLPRTEGGDPPPRPIPEFTMHQRHGRGFGGRGFRHGHQHGGGNHQFRNGNNQSNGNEPDGNRAPQPGRPGGGGGRRRRRRRR